MPRDRRLERDWLERAARDPEFAPRVAARLERASAYMGEDSFRERTLSELVGEIAEEALDVAGWGVLAIQLDAPPGAPPDVVARVHQMIEDAAMLGAIIDLSMRGAEQLLKPYLDAPAT